VFRWSEIGMRDALHLFGQALQRDPEFAPAAAMAAYCYVQRQSYGWMDDRATESAICESLARQAAQTTRDDAVSLARAAHALAAVVGDIDGGSSLIERACRLNPNLALARYVRGWIHLFAGDTERATAELMVALQLSPSDPMSFKTQAALSYANFFAGRYDDASHAAERALRARPGYLTAMRGAAAAHALRGRLAQARELMAGMRALDGRLRVSGLDKLLPFERALHRDRWADGLHRAGLPD
jgi:tetratricopeptide (TPR) repeat protein